MGPDQLRPRLILQVAITIAAGWTGWRSGESRSLLAVDMASERLHRREGEMLIDASPRRRAQTIILILLSTWRCDRFP
jgi:hypothetical protein